MRKASFWDGLGHPLRIGSLTVMMFAIPSEVYAQTDYYKQQIYHDFLAGFQTTLSDITVLLQAGATALLLGLWQDESVHRVWPFFLFGIILGGVVGALDWISPVLPAYTAALLTGLAAAASLRISFFTMSAIVTGITIILMNSLLSGYQWELIPPFTYLGITIALIAFVISSCLLIRNSIQLLSYSWVVIAWRAASAWVVAIAVLMIAIRLNNPPSELENWFENWTNS